MAILRTLGHVDRVLERAETVLVVLLLAGGALLNFALVVSRYFFARSYNELDEIAVYLIIWMVFAGALACDRRRGHIAVDVVHNWVGSHTRQILIRIADALQALVCLVLAVLTFGSVRFAYRIGEVSLSSMAQPIWAVMAIVPVAFALMGVRALARSFSPEADRDTPPTEAAL